MKTDPIHMLGGSQGKYLFLEWLTRHKNVLKIVNVTYKRFDSKGEALLVMMTTVNYESGSDKKTWHHVIVIIPRLFCSIILLHLKLMIIFRVWSDATIKNINPTLSTCWLKLYHFCKETEIKIRRNINVCAGEHR